jgi:hypothetical protein
LSSLAKAGIEFCCLGGAAEPLPLRIKGGRVISQHMTNRPMFRILNVALPVLA